MLATDRHGYLDHFLSKATAHASRENRDTLDAILGTQLPASWNLRLTPAEDILSLDELAEVDKLSALPPVNIPAPREQMVIILKATRLCNLRCTYCNAWRDGPGQIMEFSVLARLIHDILQSPNVKNIDFVWHGGEVTILPIDYLEKALWLQQHFCNPRTRIANSIQTNATRLTDEWIAFLKAYGFGVGVSIDGPPEIHDKRRVNVAGNGTWKDVKRGIDLLQENEIPFGALAVIDECALEYGADSYLRYLVNVGIRQVALLNALPPNSEQSRGQAAYLPFDRFTTFLRELFSAWWHNWKERIVIRELQSLVEAVTRGSTALCVFNDNCMGQYLTIDPNGDVSACDKYVDDPNYMFGNLHESSLTEMLSHSAILTAAVHNVSRQKRNMSTCEYYKYCFGGCPHDVRLSEKYRPNWSFECCGLNHLIAEIMSAVGMCVEQ